VSGRSYVSTIQTGGSSWRVGSLGKLAVVAGGTAGIHLASANFYSISDCQDGLSDIVEELQPELHEVFVRVRDYCAFADIDTPLENLLEAGRWNEGNRKAVNCDTTAKHPRDRCCSFADLRTRHSREFNSSEGEQRRAWLFADGSCWSEVMARLQAAGLNVTAVQNPLTPLPEAAESARRVLAQQRGPTALVGLPSPR
jgi:hypothetical protein